MLRIAFIIFRESLEIALLLSIISAVIQHFKGARIYLIAGTMLGVVLAAIFAFFTQKLTISFYGTGDEIVDALVIMFTVFIIGWTIIWMQNYSTDIKIRFNSIATCTNELEFSARIVLILTIASVILREGIEIILILYGISSVQELDALTYMYGLAIGVTSGMLFGLATYYSLVKLSRKKVFKVSSVLLLFLAAGLASEAAGLMSSVGIIMSLSETLWDSSWLLTNSSWLGNILQSILGYQAKPKLIQVIFYCSTIIIITALSRLKYYYLKTKK